MTRSEILRLAKNRMIAGYRKHGKFNAKTDTRDLYQEAIEECLDTLNYMIMQIQKLEEGRKKWR